MTAGIACLVFLAAAVAGAAEPPTAVQTGPGRRVIAADDSTRTLAAIAADGSVEWKLPCRQIHDLHLLPDGHLLYQDGWTRVVEVDADRKPVWQYDAKGNGNAARGVEVHAFQRLPDGSTMIVESGPARIIEVDRAGTIVREIPLTVDSSSTHSDTRNARKTAAGTYLVAHEKDGVVREYDAAGKVVWEFDVPLFDRPRKGGHGPEAFGDQVYSAERLSSGNTLIGTGNGHSVLEVTPEKEIVWKLEQNDLPGITLAWVTQVRRLPSGNTLVVNCHAGPANPQIIEVTPEKKKRPRRGRGSRPARPRRQSLTVAIGGSRTSLRSVSPELVTSVTGTTRSVGSDDSIVNGTRTGLPATPTEGQSRLTRSTSGSFVRLPAATA